jgi:hypothetical protein
MAGEREVKKMKNWIGVHEIVTLFNHAKKSRDAHSFSLRRIGSSQVADFFNAIPPGARTSTSSSRMIIASYSARLVSFTRLVPRLQSQSSV